jgi:hypothetical protein
MTRRVVITGIGLVSPLVGAVGTAITITGEQLNPLSGQTAVYLNLQRTVPSSVTGTQIVFPIPTNAGSGKVTVTTPFGRVTGVRDILIPPHGIAPAKIVQVKRLAIDAPAQSFATTNPDNYAIALFDGTGDDYLTAQFTDISVASIAYTLYDVHKRDIASGTITPASPTLLVRKLSARGTYLLLMRPATGPATWNLAIERDKGVEIDGDSHDVMTELSGQPVRLTFTGMAGQRQPIRQVHEILVLELVAVHVQRA